MPTILSIGLVTGFVSALMFISAVSGSLLSLVIYWLTFLPLFIAGLGWRADAALTGSGIGALLLFLVFGSKLALLYFFLIGLPTTLLCAQTNLNVAGGTNKYAPLITPGLMIIALALFASILGCLMFYLISVQETVLRNEIITLIKNSALKLPLPNTGELTDTQKIHKHIDFILYAIPPVAALSWMSSILFNYWLGGQICQMSGILSQPIQSFKNMHYPFWVTPLFAVSLMVSSMDGMAGAIGLSLAFSLWFAFILLGVIILTFLWRESKLAGLWTTLLLLSLFIFGWIVNIVPGFIGLIDPIIKFRSRKSNSTK